MHKLCRKHKLSKYSTVPSTPDEEDPGKHMHVFTDEIPMQVLIALRFTLIEVDGGKRKSERSCIRVSNGLKGWRMPHARIPNSAQPL
jgi:hypothetical protein